MTTFGRITANVQKILYNNVYKMSYSDYRNNLVAYCKKSDIFVCLHRNDEFPYEHSKPISNIESVLSEKESPLKIQLHEQDIIRYKQKPPCPEDLSKILYTNMQDLRPTIRKIKKEKIFIRDHL